MRKRGSLGSYQKPRSWLSHTACKVCTNKYNSTIKITHEDILMSSINHNKDEHTSTKSWDVLYEWKAVTLLCLGFGLVGIDRFMIMPLFPIMAKDLNLTYEHLGWITGSLAIAWGVSAIFMGSLSDKLGHRKVIIPAIIVFSLLAGLSGLATSVFILIMIRSAMGFAEGAYTPSSIVATIDASKPERQGRNVGIQQAALPLFGLGIAPIFVTQLLKVVEWHWVFAFVSIPGLIVAALLYRHLRDTPKKSCQAAYC